MVVEPDIVSLSLVCFLFFLFLSFSHSCFLPGQEHAEEEGWLLKELRFWCAHNHLEPQETPQAVYVEKLAWSEAEGLLTPTMKKKRSELLQKYTIALSELYQSNLEKADKTQFSDAFVSALTRAGVNSNVSGMTPTVTLAELGANSLAVAKLVQLFRESNVEISVKSIYVQPLAYLDGILLRAQTGEVVAPAEPLHSVPNLLGDYKFETPTKEQQRTATPSAVLITGGTGFFGSYLIPKVLEAFPTQIVYVLVRGSPARVATWLRGTKTWQGCERLWPIPGDVSLDRLGMSTEAYQGVCESVGDVFHCAARVDIAAPVEALLETNVEGTKRVIELCLLARAKLHYFSSLSAVSSQQQEQESWHVITDANELGRKTGYGASKALAERLVHTAMVENGLEVRVIRTATVCGDSRTGAAWNTSDFIYLLLKFWADAKVVVTPSSLPLRWLPAPYVANVMVTLAHSPSAANRCFDIVGNGPTLLQLREQLILQLQGSPCRVIEPSRWPEEVYRLTGKTNNKLLLDQFAKVKFFADDDANTDKTPPATQAELQRLNLPVPQVGEEFAAACVAHVLDSRPRGHCFFCGQPL